MEKLPEDKWTFHSSLQQNDMFILGMPQNEFDKAIAEMNKKLLSDYLFIVWSISESDYWFRHHLETKNSELKSLSGARESSRYYRFKSISAFEKLNPKKIRINCLGDAQFINY